MAKRTIKTPLEIRLWLHLKWDVPAGACWKWSGALDKQGYGVIGVGKRTCKVHRVVYELVFKRKLKPHDTILHLCDEPACANPEHLLRGNSTDNTVDMAIKCRGRFQALSDNYARFLYEALKQRFEPHECDYE